MDASTLIGGTVADDDFIESAVVVSLAAFRFRMAGPGVLMLILRML
jgi:hypothetical protein